MRWSFLLILPFLAGCLAPPTAVAPPTVAASPASVSSAPAADPGLAAPVAAEGDALAAAQPNPGTLPGRVGASLSLLDGEELSALADPELEEELPDPETLADNALLSGLHEAPPEDEGETVEPAGVSFDFPVVENEKVHYYIDLFTGSARQVFTRWLERSGRYLPLMQQIFAEEGLPLDLAYLAMVESGFNNRAYSWAHAAGPWQFISSTGRIYGMDSDWWLDERRDFEKSTRAAARFLKDLYAQFGGNWYLAVASYNAGPGKIQRAISMYNTTDFWEISRGSYLALETKNYVPKLLAVLLIAKQPEKYGFTDLQYMEPIAFETVELPSATDLEIVAKFCEVSYEEIKDLNPELKRWCTPPSLRNYPLRVPPGKKEIFEQQYSLLSEDRRANYQRHKIRKGDNLQSLARRYNIRIEDIMAMNRISNPRALRIGADLILPLRQGLSAIPLRELGDDPPKRRQTAYTVRKGDSLWVIARKFDVSEKDLRRWNGLKGSTLRPGQVLQIAAASTPAKRSGRGDEGRRTAYEVRPGDNLSKIARQFGVSVEDLREWNRLSRNHILRPGQKLTVLAKGGGGGKAQVARDGKGKNSRQKIVYQVRPGDTLWDISRRFDVATKEILGWNNLDESHILRPGDKLTLMVEEGRPG